MIVFDLSCADGHRFEGWFGSSADYAEQQEQGLLACPHCGLRPRFSKAPMAPAVAAKGNARTGIFYHPVPVPEVSQQLVNAPRLRAQGAKGADCAQAKAQAEALKIQHLGRRQIRQGNARDAFMASGTKAPIHGQATLAEAQALIDEGVQVAPLPFPVAPPEKLN